MILSRLPGRRIVLRPITARDFEAWRELRERNRDWLARWEPRPPDGQVSESTDRVAFAARCSARQREWQMGSGYGFGIFLHPDVLAGEVNISGVQRGPFQNAYVGYWIDEARAGQGYVPEAVVVGIRFAFEHLGLHRLQVAIIPRNRASRRVMEKLGIRAEGVAERYLCINGVWEDHVRYAITAEEWSLRRDELWGAWVG